MNRMDERPPCAAQRQLPRPPVLPLLPPRSDRTTSGGTNNSRGCWSSSACTGIATYRFDTLRTLPWGDGVGTLLVGFLMSSTFEPCCLLLSRSLNDLFGCLFSFLATAASQQRAIYKSEMRVGSSGPSVARQAAPDYQLLQERLQRLMSVDFDWNPVDSKQRPWEWRFSELVKFVVSERERERFDACETDRLGTAVECLTYPFLSYPRL